MKHKFFRESGQALILIALGAIGLFGVAGLAIDGSAKFSDRRHAQNAADTAALAGALAMARGDAQWDLDALNRALQNGYDDDHVSNEVEVYSPPQSGIYANCNDIHFTCTDYVQVIITSHVDTWFARVIGILQTHNRVEAVASKISQQNGFNFGGNAIVALSPTGCGLVAGGTTNVQINGGGLFANSDSSCAFKKQSCAGLVDVNNTNGTQGTITTVGGYALNSGCLPSADMSMGAKQIPFPPPYQEIAEPAECSTPGTITPSGSILTLSPGAYDKIPGNGQPWNGTSKIILEPGVYCLTGTGATLNPNNNQTLEVAGTYGVTPGVFIYFQPGGYFTFNAQVTVNLWGIRQVDVTSNPDLEPYKGFLMYLAPDYASGTPVNCTINGGADDKFMGTIFAPFCDIKLNGSSGSTGFNSQLIGYTVDLTGASGVTIYYESGSNATFTIPLQVGLSK